MSGRRFCIVDVFVTEVFGGNPLAVILDADGLDQAAMQRIAREFNFSETTFVLPSNRDDADFQVRIFTPTQEVPFAGHPNLGTAFALQQSGLLTGKSVVRFDEQAGIVPVQLGRRAGLDFFELKVPEPVSLGDPLPRGQIAQVLSLDEAQISVHQHAPRTASVGLPFLTVALRDAQALAGVSIDMPALRDLAASGTTPDIFCYYRDPSSATIDARVFAPLDGVVEDPATGSANGALAGLLTSLEARDGEYRYAVSQGVQMGRPSHLSMRATRTGGQVADVFVGGVCRWFCDGKIARH